MASLWVSMICCCFENCRDSGRSRQPSISRLDKTLGNSASGPRRDGISDEKGLLPRWPEEGPRLLWKVDGLGRGWSSPIIVNKRLYITGDVGNDLVVFAFDTDGAPQWRTTNGAAWSNDYLGAWHMGEPDVPDATPHGNDGTANLNTNAAGSIGIAQKFDGNASYVDCGTNAVLEPGVRTRFWRGLQQRTHRALGARPRARAGR